MRSVNRKEGGRLAALWRRTRGMILVGVPFIMGMALILGGCPNEAGETEDNEITITVTPSGGGALATITAVVTETQEPKRVTVEILDAGGTDPVLYDPYNAEDPEPSLEFMLGFFKGGTARFAVTAPGAKADGTDFTKTVTITVPDKPFANAIWTETSFEDKNITLTVNNDGTFESAYYGGELPWAKGTWRYGEMREEDGQREVILTVEALWGEYLFEQMWYGWDGYEPPDQEVWYNLEDIMPSEGTFADWMGDDYGATFLAEFRPDTPARLAYGILDNTLRLVYWTGLGWPPVLLFSEWTPLEGTGPVTPGGGDGSHYQTGEVIQYKTHTTGDGIPIFIYGIYFGGDELAHSDMTGPDDAAHYGGTGWYEEVAKRTADMFFLTPVIRDFEAYFDVYIYMRDDAIHPVPVDGTYNGDKEIAAAKTAARKTLGTDYNRCSIIYLGNGFVGGYALFGSERYPAGGGLGVLEVRDTTRENYYPEKPTFTAAEKAQYWPLTMYWIAHEFMGHAFAQLADEYGAYPDEEPTDPATSGYGDWIDQAHAANTGLWNVYYSLEEPAPADVPWAAFIGREGYSEADINLSEDFPGQSDNVIGIFEGGMYCETGIWRATVDSFINGWNNHVNGFQRYLIWRHIMDLAGVTNGKPRSTGFQAIDDPEVLAAFFEYDKTPQNGHKANTRTDWDEEYAAYP